MPTTVRARGLAPGYRLAGISGRRSRMASKQIFVSTFCRVRLDSLAQTIQNLPLCCGDRDACALALYLILVDLLSFERR